VGGGSSASVWGDHGSYLALSTTSITNDTVTAIDNSSFASVRGTQFHTTGKYYYEVKLLTAPSADALYIGILDDQSGPAGMNSPGLVRSVTTYCNDGTGTAAGSGLSAVNIGSAATLTTNDILGIAFDADNGFHYFSRNGTYFLSGNPTSGSAGSGSIGTYTGLALGPNYYPTVAVWGLVNCVVQLITGASAIASGGRLPSGYTAWG
jgi:hypothetical protein